MKVSDAKEEKRATRALLVIQDLPAQLDHKDFAVTLGRVATKEKKANKALLVPRVLKE